MIVDVIVSDHFEIVGEILDRRFRHRGSKIQKAQLGIFFDNLYYFEGVVEPFIHGCVCEREERNESTICHRCDAMGYIYTTGVDLPVDDRPA